MYELLIAPFAEYEFMRRALVGCFALALGATPVGVFLVLRRMSLTGDAIAHAVLPGVAIGYLVSSLSLGAMAFGGLVAGIALALLAGLVTRVTLLREDASLATFHLIWLATGVIIVSVWGTNVDLLHILFGTVLAVDDPTLLLMAAVATVSLGTIAVLYRSLIAASFDPTFLRSVSRRSGWERALILVLAALNLVSGFHTLGTLMAIGLMILPAATARFWMRDVDGMIGFALVMGMACSAIGLLVSYHWNAPSGPAIVLVAGVVYMLSVLFGPLGSVRVTARIGRRVAW